MQHTLTDRVRCPQAAGVNPRSSGGLLAESEVQPNQTIAIVAAIPRRSGTRSTVARVASEHGHDSFVMLNVYPQRSTDPRGLHTTVEPDLRDANERHIAALVRGRRLTIWAAWGTNIVTRSYLSPCLRGLLALPELAQCVWVSRGPTSKVVIPTTRCTFRATAHLNRSTCRVTWRRWAQRLGGLLREAIALRLPAASRNEDASRRKSNPSSTRDESRIDPQPVPGWKAQASAASRCGPAALLDGRSRPPTCARGR